MIIEFITTRTERSLLLKYILYVCYDKMSTYITLIDIWVCVLDFRHVTYFIDHLLLDLRRLPPETKQYQSVR